MKKSFRKRIGKILGIAVLIALMLVGGIFIYIKTQATVKVTTKTGALHELTIEEKLEDFNYIYKVLKENHPYFEVEKRKTGYDWLEHKGDFENWIKATNNNKDYYRTIERILYLVQNGHTNIILPEMYDEYRKLYSGIGNNAWSNVLNDEDVAIKYEEWKKIIDGKSSVIPLSFKYIEGSYIVTNPSLINEDILKKYNIPKYSMLKDIDGVNIEDYINSIMDKKFLKFDNKRSKLKASSLSIPCQEGKSMQLTFLTPDGKIVERNLQGIEYVAPKRSMTGPEKLYETAVIENGKLAYIKVSSFSAFYVEKDREGIYKFFEEVKDYPNLIIDIRGNGGGSENYYTRNLVSPLIDKKLEANFYMVFRDGDYIKPFMKSRGMFAKSIDSIPNGLMYPEEINKDFSAFIPSTREISPKDSVGFKGKIFLIVDDYVYSSAESFAVFAKATGFATIVGTRTGGDGIGIDPAICALPNSGLIIRFPLEMGLNPDGTSNEETHTDPDIYAEQTYEDFIKYNEYKGEIINPYDTVMNKVIEMTK